MTVAPLRVLLLDDNADDRQLTLRELRKDFPDSIATEPLDEAQFQAAVRDQEFDLVITDYQLRWSDGVRVVKTVKEIAPHCPVIMFTATGTQEVAVDAMKAGLDDYVIKSPRHYIRLAAAVRSCLDRVEVRRRALRSETRLRTLLDRLNVGVFRMTMQGELIDVNRACQQICDRFADRIGAASAPPANRVFAAIRELLPQLLHTNDAVERELRFGEGNDVYIYVSLLRVRINGHDAVDGLVEDISKIRRAVVRSSELEDSNRALESFAFTVAHDLREPLRNIDGYARALREDCLSSLPQKCIGYVERIGEVTARMDGMVTDVLEFSRLSNAELPQERVAVAQVVQDALALLQAEAERSQATITVVVDPSQQVCGHHQTLMQVITNILSNAIKFVAPQVKPVIHVHTEADDDKVRLLIKDNGIGIAEEDIGSIFEVFHRLHVQEKYPGTGVGLALVRRGVERMGGEVAVESQLGHGSRFWVVLKRA